MFSIKLKCILFYKYLSLINENQLHELTTNCINIIIENNNNFILKYHILNEL